MASDVFAVLADPTRRHIVELLHAGERSVGELVRDAGIAQPGVSRHLRILHEAGFVTVRSAGQRRLYTLRPEPLRALEAWMRRYAHDQVERLERLERLVDGPPEPARPAPSPRGPRKRTLRPRPKK